MKSTKEEIQQLIKDQEELCNNYNLKIKEMKDFREKCIGDRIIMWDFSFNEEKGTKKHFIKEESSFADKVAIIIEENCNYKRKPYKIEVDFNTQFNYQYLDLLIRYDDGTEIYTHSDMVRRID